MITKFSDSKSLVKNDLTASGLINRDNFFRSFVSCKFNSLACKRVESQSKSCLQIQGLASNYNFCDLANDVITKGAFDNYVDEDGFFLNIPKMYYEHDTQIIPGEWTSVRINKIGIEVEGRIFCEKIISLVEENALNGLSIGFYVCSSEWRYNMATNQRYRYISNARLVEISLVKNPANHKAFFSPAEPTYFGSVSNEKCGTSSVYG